ncbi:transforming growth factor beta-1-induced transcript 1 protein-like [Paramacrobiotus metropolitanus]|uniref:transforming growth factor beta-1-induced transcript 1 protein-like n=1 Tax=Paramacrobiotus metropolitanus TaxID=2943436 RepID=UPI002445D76A|nr:transforming growth factor beta-1-induced transcript 1 protein-like [Paramacrobiotus metropolitanus]
MPSARHETTTSARDDGRDKLEHTETMVRDDRGNPSLTEVRDYREGTRTIHHNATNGMTGFAACQGERNDIGHPTYRKNNFRTGVQGDDCSVCVEPLTDEERVQAVGRHFHRNCFDTAHSGQCHGCGENIRITQPSLTVSALSRDWHTGCLTCGQCPDKITGEFQWSGDAPLCDNCYRGIAPGCAGCNQAIFGDKLKAMNMFFHPDCFDCQVCHEPLYKGGKDYFNVEGKPYCTRDVHYVTTAVYAPA